VHLLDEQGAELPGFGLADAIPITEDAARVSARWKVRQTGAP
jgi:hypothetical protein